MSLLIKKAKKDGSKAYGRVTASSHGFGRAAGDRIVSQHSDGFFNVQPQIRPFVNMDGSSSRFCINSNEGLALNKNYIYPSSTQNKGEHVRRPQSVFATDRFRLPASYRPEPKPPVPESTKQAYDYELYLRYIDFKKKNREK